MRNRLLLAAAIAISAMCATAASAANFILNPGFEAATSGATDSVFSADGGASAAPSWTLYNNSGVRTATEIVASDAPGGEDQMLHITTLGGNNGVYQAFGGFAQYAVVSVKVLSGTVALYLYSDSGNHQEAAAFSTVSSGWQTLSLSTSSANSNEVVIYSYGGGAEFYVDNAYASNEARPLVGGVPEPASWALMIGGFGLAGATLRRRRALAA